MRQQKVKPSAIGEAVSRVLREYSDDVIRQMPDATKTAAKNCVKYLKAEAKKQIGGTVYNKSFRSKNVRSTSSYTSYRVYSTKYQLTHLLEHGHMIVVHGKRLNRMTRAFPHWKPAEEKAVKDLEKDIKQRIEGVL